MSAATEKKKAVDELLEKTRGSLDRKAYFEAERMALKALQIARQVNDFERMIMAVTPLWEAREGRLKAALSGRKVTVVDEPVTENTKVKPGCYLVEPPQVGADGRRLRLSGLQNDVAVAVICREPLTQLKQWPIVAIGAGVTMRARIAPPKDQSKPDMKWFAGAMEQLGEWAMQTIDPTLEPVRRIDVILERLDTVPDYRGLHELLIETCHEAIEARDNAPPPEPPRKRGRRAKQKS